MRKIPRVLLCLLLGLLIINNVLGTAISVPNVSKDIVGNKTATGLTKTAGNIWKTLADVMQILAIACVVFAGIRYMFANANTRADIKRELIILVVGAVLVFGASAILKIVFNVTNDVLTTNLGNNMFLI